MTEGVLAVAWLVGSVVILVSVAVLAGLLGDERR